MQKRHLQDILKFAKNNLEKDYAKCIMIMHNVSWSLGWTKQELFGLEKEGREMQPREHFRLSEARWGEYYPAGRLQCLCNLMTVDKI